MTDVPAGPDDASRKKVTVRPPRRLGEAFEALCEDLGATQTAMLEAFMEHATDAGRRGEIAAWVPLVERARRISGERRRGRRG